MAFAALFAMLGPAHIVSADELESFCAQAKKASSIVICSDAELRQQAIARNRLFEAARAKLSPEAYKALTEDQSRWIKAYTARCGVAIDDPPPVPPIPQSVIDCYRRESRARTADLAAHIGEPGAGAAALSPSTEPPPPEWKSAQAKWMNCLSNAVSGLAAQPEPAQTVAEAAIGSCGRYEAEYADVSGLTPASFQGIKTSVVIPKVIAWVMEAREAASKARQRFQGDSAEKYADSLAVWMRCTQDATDHLATQPEPAQTVVAAAYGLCVKEEMAHQAAGRLTDDAIQKAKAFLTPLMLARVMAIRAARANHPEATPQPKPAIDYNHM